MGSCIQLETHLKNYLMSYYGKPWKQSSKSRKYYKQLKARKERRRAKLNPDCVPGYGKYKGWEF